MVTIIIYKETVIKNSYRKENFKTEKKLLRDLLYVIFMRESMEGEY